MKHWENGWQKVLGKTLPTALCLYDASISSFFSIPKEAVKDAKDVTCPACLKILQKCGLL